MQVGTQVFPPTRRVAVRANRLLLTVSHQQALYLAKIGGCQGDAMGTWVAGHLVDAAVSNPTAVGSALGAHPFVRALRPQ